MVKQENRGGHREGSGRKRISISDVEVKKLLRENRKLEKETGDSVWGILAKVIQGKIRSTVKERLTAIKLYAECTITKAVQSESVVSKANEPAIYLPKPKVDPANVVPMKQAGNG